jgi:hypothetical protein
LAKGPDFRPLFAVRRAEVTQFVIDRTVSTHWQSFAGSIAAGSYADKGGCTQIG